MYYNIPYYEDSIKRKYEKTYILKDNELWKHYRNLLGNLLGNIL